MTTPARPGRLAATPCNWSRTVRRSTNPNAGTARVRVCDGGELVSAAINARVWSAIHFRTADVVAAQMGTEVWNWALDHYVRPTHCMWPSAGTALSQDLD